MFHLHCMPRHISRELERQLLAELDDAMKIAESYGKESQDVSDSSELGQFVQLMFLFASDYWNMSYKPDEGERAPADSPECTRWESGLLPGLCDIADPALCCVIKWENFTVEKFCNLFAIPSLSLAGMLFDLFGVIAKRTAGVRLTQRSHPRS